MIQVFCHVSPRKYVLTQRAYVLVCMLYVVLTHAFWPRFVNYRGIFIVKGYDVILRVKSILMATGGGGCGELVPRNTSD